MDGSRCPWAKINHIAESKLGLEDFRGTIGIGRTNPTCSIGIANPLVHIYKRDHGAVDEWLKVIIECTAKTNSTNTCLGTEMLADQVFKINSHQSTSSLKYAS